jgi:AbiV family abortive infection protein
VSRKRQKGPLTPKQLGEVAEASLANAADLIGEARALFEAGAVARAYSLAVLAGEEFGKCQLAIGSVGRDTAGDDYWRDWWAVFYGHGPKLAQAAFIANQFLSMELVEAFLRILEPALEDQRREVGFYVDVVAGGAVSPATAIDAEEARDAIGNLR